MQLSFTEKKSIRKNFGSLKEILSIPNLIEVQKKSYNQFLTSKVEAYETVKTLCKNYEKLCKERYPEAPLPLEILSN